MVVALARLSSRAPHQYILRQLGRVQAVRSVGRRCGVSDSSSWHLFGAWPASQQAGTDRDRGCARDGGRPESDSSSCDSKARNIEGRLRKYRELVRRYRLAACDSAQSSSTVIAGAGAAVAGVVAAAAASPLVASACVVTSAMLVSQEWLTRHAPAVKRARVVRQDASLRTIEATVEHDGMEVEHEVDIPYAASPEQEEGVKRHKRLQSNWASESSALRKLDVTAAGDHKARDSERKRAWRLNRHQQREVHAVL